MPLFDSKNKPNFKQIPCESCGRYDRMYVQGVDNFGNRPIRITQDDTLECDNCGSIMSGKRYLETVHNFKKPAPSSGTIGGIIKVVDDAPAVKRGRGRPRKNPISVPVSKPVEKKAEAVEPVAVKRGRGRPRKNPVMPLPEVPAVKRGRGRPRKNV